MIEQMSSRDNEYTAELLGSDHAWKLDYRLSGRPRRQYFYCAPYTISPFSLLMGSSTGRLKILKDQPAKKANNTPIARSIV